jgi:hypothetical protein
MCNILIYFCNIHMKHLQHTSKISETLEIYACTYGFSATSPCCLGEWRIVVVWSSLVLSSLVARTSRLWWRRPRRVSILCGWSANYARGDDEVRCEMCVGELDPCRRDAQASSALATTSWASGARDVCGRASPGLPWATRGWAPPQLRWAGQPLPRPRWA